VLLIKWAIGVGIMTGLVGCPAPECTGYASGPTGVYSAAFPIPFGGDVDAGALTVTRDGEVVEGHVHKGYFYPQQHLLPATEYAWSVANADGCEPSDGRFSTSEVGREVLDPEALIGRTFSVNARSVDHDFYSAGWLALVMRHDMPPYRIRINEINGDEAIVTLAQSQRPISDYDPSESALQDYCTASRELVGTWDGARLRLTGDRLALPVGEIPGEQGLSYGYPAGDGGDMDLLDWTIEVVVHPLGDLVSLSEFTFVADSRRLSRFGFLGSTGFHPGDGTAENFCQITLIVGVECEACDDGLMTCLPTSVWDPKPGEFVDPVIRIDSDQRENHLCEDVCDNDVDDDDDRIMDDDAECDARQWP
jgi:hypothetical protein